MQYGVKNYLLKPCNDLKIKEALKEIIDELRCMEDQKRFINNLRENMEKAKPYIKTQLLTEFLSGNIYANRDIGYYQGLFDIEISKNMVRLILFQLEGEFGYEHLFAIKNIGAELFDSPVLNINLGEYALFLVEDHGEVERLQHQIELIRERFFQYYKIDTTIAVSDKGYIRNARKLYLEALECLKHRFYLGEGSIITKEDISPGNTNHLIGTMFDEQQICMLIKSGNMTNVNLEVSVFFEKIADLRPEINLAKSYCLQLFLAVVQTGETERMQIYLDGISSIMKMGTVQQMKEYIEKVASEITHEYYTRFKSKQSSVIDKVISIMNEQFGNPELSLKQVANTILYMNADYLGKLFKQETGERFSSYLTKIRIENAIEHISEMEDVKIVSLAEMIGFGDNPQYFSQVFKKYTGYTPTEYRKVP
jgi:two-component system response regulator YesN